MADTNKKLICHRGFWREPEQQNTTQAILDAFSSGFDVEIDIRLGLNGKLVSGHDTAQEFDWDAVLSFPKRKMIAFHIKERGMAHKLWDLIGDMDYLEYTIFGVLEDEMQDYKNLFGYESIAFEYNAGDDFEKVFNCRNKVIWIAELDGKQVSKKELIVLKSIKKIIYLVTSDCVAGDMILFGVRLAQYEQGLLDGVCSDNCDIISKYVK